MLSDEPVVAVGAGATTILGASSLSKVLRASRFMRTFKIPASFRLMLPPTRKGTSDSLRHVSWSFKIGGHSGLLVWLQKTSASKATASAEKIRTVAQVVITSAEKTSLSAMTAAFHEIMRKRRAKPAGFLPRATFGCSVATFAGLLVLGDGIEHAAESLRSRNPKLTAGISGCRTS